jgi:hypothetical protein
MVSFNYWISCRIASRSSFASGIILFTGFYGELSAFPRDLPEVDMPFFIVRSSVTLCSEFTGYPVVIFVTV